MKEKLLNKKELFEILNNRYEIAITNNTLKYYSLLKIIEPGKIIKGKGLKGITSYYSQKSLKDIFLIRYCQKNTNWSLEKIKQFQDISNFKDLKTLKKFSESTIETVSKKTGGLIIKLPEAFWELADFQEFMAYKAAIELDLLDINYRFSLRQYPDQQDTIYIDKSDEEYLITVNFISPINKRAIFKKSGTTIEEIK
jgi:DNA-binding transcriptional MerR regulator